MSRIAVVFIVVSTAIMFTIMLAVIAWIVSDLASQGLGRGLFVGGFTLMGVIGSAWLGVRLAQPIVKRNREYFEEQRRKHSG